MSQAVTLSALRERIRQIEQPLRHSVLPFGVEAIDAVLPGGGLARGAVHEILATGGDEEDAASAAGFAAGIVARLGTRPPPGSTILWCQKSADLYGPGLQAHGLDPARLVLVTARRDSELLWVIEEALNAGPAAGIAAVVGEIGRLPMVAGRRLQLAAERSGITALLLRRWHTAAEANAERERPSAALTRWRITALPSGPFAPAARLLLPPPPAGEGRGGGYAGTNLGKLVGQPRWRIELLRCRGGRPGNWAVEVADAAGFVSFSAGLADRPVAPPHAKTAAARVGPLRRAG
jgi:protein ImuA